MKNVVLVATLLFVTAFAQTGGAPPVYADADVSLKTATGVIRGSELVPTTSGKMPVVLLHAGSGPTDRNGNSRLLTGANNSLKQLAEALAREGIASVRYDKRGISESAPAMVAEKDLRFDHYVDDATAWVRQLKADPRFSKVIVVGHSEGALIGMLAAQRGGADAYVSIAGIARPADEVLRDQLKPKLPPALYTDADRVLTSLKAGKTVDDAPPALAALFRPSVQPYLISWLRHSPAEIAATLAMPTLIAQGTTDIQVGVAEAKALARAKPDAELIVVEGMNHVLKLVEADPAKQMTSYGDPSLPVAPKLVEAVAAFVKRLK